MNILEHSGKSVGTKTLMATAFFSLLLLSQQAFSQDTSNRDRANAEQMDQSNIEQIFSIRAQLLSSALDQFSEQTGISFAYSSQALNGIQSPGVSGEFPLRQALNVLLTGTGVSAQFTSSDSVTLTKVETTGTNAPLVLAPIKVSGELIERDLQESQSSVSIFTDDVIDNSYITNIEEIFARIPNVSNVGEITIRGIPDRGLGSGVGDTSPTTAVYIDGAVQSFYGGRNGIQSTWDLDQIEVYRGPQTTSLGRSALAGSVVINTRDPEFVWDLKARLGAGENETEQYALAFGGPIIDDLLAFRLSADINNSDGFTRFENNGVVVDDIGVNDRENYRGKLLLTPNERLTAQLTVNYSDASRGNNTVFGERIFDGISTGITSVTTTEVNSSVLEVNYNLSDAVFITSTTSYTDTSQSFIPIEATVANRIAGGDEISGFAEDENLTQEVKLTYDDGEALRGTLGFYYADLEEFGERVFDSTLTFPFGVFELDGGDSYNNSYENFAIFGEMEYDLSSHWTVIAGGRYDQEDATRSESQELDLTPDFAGFPDTSVEFSGDSSFDALLPKLGVIYNFNKDVSLSFNVQRGYRPGGADINPGNDQPIEFDPEFTNNYDIAFRSVWLDGDLYMNANAYYVDYTDMQLRFAPDPEMIIIRFIANAGEAELYGLEFDAGYQVSNELLLYSAFALGEGELKEFFFQGNDLSGSDIPNAPNFTASFGGTYTHSSGFSVTVDSTYTDNYAVGFNGDGEVDGYFLTDLRAGYQFEKWSISAYVKNLFDKDYVLSGGINDLDPTLSAATLGEPQTIGFVVDFEI